MDEAARAMALCDSRAFIAEGRIGNQFALYKKKDEGKVPWYVPTRFGKAFTVIALLPAMAQATATPRMRWPRSRVPQVQSRPAWSMMVTPGRMCTIL